MMDDYDRMQNGVNILKSGAVTELTPVKRLFRVTGNTGNYTVSVDEDNNWACTCKDHTERGRKFCKHIWSCIMKVSLEME
jgi:hypothetical protein